MSKRAKFVFVTWVGPSVSVMKKAKMSTDKALMKDIIQVVRRSVKLLPYSPTCMIYGYLDIHIHISNE